MPQFMFDASTVEVTQQSREAIPAGYYLVSIHDTKISPTQKAGGEKLEWRCKVLDQQGQGTQYKGRSVFESVNVKNANPEAERIGKGQLAAALLAINKPRIQMTEEMHDQQCVIRVSLDKEEYTPNGGQKQIVERNNIREYQPAGRWAEIKAKVVDVPANMHPNGAAFTQPAAQPQYQPQAQPQFQQPAQQFAQPQAQPQFQQPQQPAFQQPQQPAFQQPAQQPQFAQPQFQQSQAAPQQFAQQQPAQALPQAAPGTAPWAVPGR